MSVVSPPDRISRRWPSLARRRAKALQLDPTAFLLRNQAYDFFAALGDLVVTGPTLTNVNDFRAILIDGAGA